MWLARHLTQALLATYERAPIGEQATGQREQRTCGQAREGSRTRVCGIDRPATETAEMVRGKGKAVAVVGQVLFLLVGVPCGRNTIA